MNDCTDSQIGIPDCNILCILLDSGYSSSIVEVNTKKGIKYQPDAPT